MDFSILNETTILTAAHCVYQDTKDLTIVAGEWKLYKDDGTEQERDVHHVKVD